VHGKSDGQVERVVSSLVLDNEGVLLNGESAQINIVLGGSDQVEKLTQLGLISRLMEEFHELNVVVGLLEVLLQEEVDGRLENESVIDSHQANLFLIDSEQKLFS